MGVGAYGGYHPYAFSQSNFQGGDWENLKKVTPDRDPMDFSMEGFCVWEKKRVGGMYA